MFRWTGEKLGMLGASVDVFTTPELKRFHLVKSETKQASWELYFLWSLLNILWGAGGFHFFFSANFTAPKQLTEMSWGFQKVQAHFSGSSVSQAICDWNRCIFLLILKFTEIWLTFVFYCNFFCWHFFTFYFWHLF